MKTEYELNTKDDKVNGYTNIQTYRLCLVLDNEQAVSNPLERFFELVYDKEFEISGKDTSIETSCLKIG